METSRVSMKQTRSTNAFQISANLELEDNVMAAMEPQQEAHSLAIASMAAEPLMNSKFVVKSMALWTIQSIPLNARYSHREAAAAA